MIRAEDLRKEIEARKFEEEIPRVEKVIQEAAKKNLFSVRLEKPLSKQAKEYFAQLGYKYNKYSDEFYNDVIEYYEISW